MAEHLGQKSLSSMDDSQSTISTNSGDEEKKQAAVPVQHDVEILSSSSSSSSDDNGEEPRTDEACTTENTNTGINSATTTNDNNPEEHTLYSFLIGRRGADIIKKLEYRRRILEKILQIPNLSNLFHDDKLKKKATKILQPSRTAKKSHLKTHFTTVTNASFIASVFVELYKLLNQEKELVNNKNKNLRKSSRTKKKNLIVSKVLQEEDIVNFIDFMEKVDLEVACLNSAIASKKNNKNAPKKKRKVKHKKSLGIQKDGVKKQDHLTWDPKLRDPQPCPACKHNFVMVVDNTAANSTNKKHMDEYEAAMEEWANMSARERQGKVKPTLSKVAGVNGESAMLACMCCKQNCGNRVNGYGCEHCFESNKIGQRPVIINGTCYCDKCSCSCDRYFSRADRHKIAEQVDNEKREAETNPKPLHTEIRKQQSAVGHLVHDIVGGDMFQNYMHQNQEYPNAPPEDLLQNAVAITQHNLNTNTRMHGDVGFRNSCVVEMGGKLTTNMEINGEELSVPQARDKYERQRPLVRKRKAPPTASMPSANPTAAVSASSRAHAHAPEHHNNASAHNNNDEPVPTYNSNNNNNNIDSTKPIGRVDYQQKLGAFVTNSNNKKGNGGNDNDTWFFSPPTAQRGTAQVGIAQGGTAKNSRAYRNKLIPIGQQQQQQQLMYQQQQQFMYQQQQQFMYQQQQHQHQPTNVVGEGTNDQPLLLDDDDDEIVGTNWTSVAGDSPANKMVKGYFSANQHHDQVARRLPTTPPRSEAVEGRMKRIRLGIYKMDEKSPPTRDAYNNLVNVKEDIASKEDTKFTYGEIEDSWDAGISTQSATKKYIESWKHRKGYDNKESES